MKLQTGFMKTQDLATWMKITYGTFRKNSNKRYELLESYCDFEKQHGGVLIKEVYIEEYQGDISKMDIKNYLEEIRSISSGLSCVAGMTRKFIEEKDDYKNMKYNTVEYRLRKAGKVAFGKTLTRVPDEEPVFEGGVYGQREYVWAVKQDDFNHYRFLSHDEDRLFDKIIEEEFSQEVTLTPQQQKQIALLDAALRRGEIESKKYLAEKNKIDGRGSRFKRCIDRFREETRGLQIVRCSLHELYENKAKEEIESAF